MFKVLNRSVSSLRQVVENRIAQDRDRVAKLKKPHGSVPVDQITVEQMVNGMQGVKALLCQTSKLDPYEGIKFRGFNIAECQDKLPGKFREPLPEAMFWLLLTGSVPSKEQLEELRIELASKAALPPYIKSLLASLPKTLNPTTQLSIGVMALGAESQFDKAYEKGMRKNDYWKPMLEDSINLVAKVPSVAATIYNNLYRSGQTPEPKLDSDWTENYIRMLGWDNQSFFEMMRLNLLLHCDHEGGNVCTHTAHLTASALSDVYKSFSAGLNGLAGPLHGLANQECLKWILEMHKIVGDNPTEAGVEVYVRQYLRDEKNFIPGFGHTVLREQDPRFTALQEYGRKFMDDCSLCKLVDVSASVIPRLLKEIKGMKHPYPTLNFNSGALMYRFGLREFDFYTVNFGVARSIGVSANLVWDKALGLPIERPASLTLENLEEFGRKN